MTDPYQVLNLPTDADDALTRQRYLELVRQFPPEHYPEKFAAIREAYERLKDLTTRLQHRLFDTGDKESINALIEELACRSPRRRLSLDTLLAIVRNP